MEAILPLAIRDDRETRMREQGRARMMAEAPSPSVQTQTQELTVWRG
jgi:hypothetical protein